jgi:hypothetical protein
VGVAKFPLLSDIPPIKLENYPLSQKIRKKIPVRCSQFVIAFGPGLPDSSISASANLRRSGIRVSDISGRADVRFTPESGHC